MAMIKILDLQFGRPHTIASFLVESREGPVLIETGPDSTFPALCSALERAGYAVPDVRHVLLTHVHLDHAGAAWRFAREGATVYVHPKGAAHLAAPQKLWASAERIYGDDMERLWGHIEPVAEERLSVVEDRQIVSIGGLRLLALDTPGHAQHHYAYRLDQSIFTGDVGGVRIGRGPVVPPCPPPDIDLTAWRDSLRRLALERSERFFLTHFGEVSEVDTHLGMLERRLFEWAEWIRRELVKGHSREEIVRSFSGLSRSLLQAHDLDPDAQAEYELADPAWMSVDGLTRYWRKYRPEALV